MLHRGDLQSQVIDWLRFPLAVAVVFIHSFGYPWSIDLDAMHVCPFTGESFYNWLRIALSNVLSHIAVPTFFTISGYLFFINVKQWNRSVYFAKLKSRFHTLLIPYLSWNVIALILHFAMACMAEGQPISYIHSFMVDNGWWHIFWDAIVSDDRFVNWLGTPITFSCPVNYPLWFLRDLFVAVLFSPLIYLYINKLRLWGIILLGLLYVSGIWPQITGLTVTAAFFFSVGAYFGICKKDMVAQCRRAERTACILAVVLFLLSVWFDGRVTLYGSLIYPFFIIVGVCAVFCLAARLVESGRVKMHPLLTDSTFFVFAAHSRGLITVGNYVANLLLPWVYTVVLAVKYLLTSVFAVAICVAVYAVMRRLFPRMMAFINGGR